MGGSDGDDDVVDDGGLGQLLLTYLPYYRWGRQGTRPYFNDNSGWMVLNDHLNLGR